MLTLLRLLAHAGSRAAATMLLVLAAALAGCASQSSRSGDRDGPPANSPPNLASVPDAQPRPEAIRSGGPNKPYEALGRRYVPMTQDLPFRETGLASWYGRKFHGRPTSTGESYDMYAITAAHPTLPLPSYARVRNPRNGREIVVRVNDRGPFHPGRIVDLSYAAALKLDLLRAVAPVELERITYDDIRTGAWRDPVQQQPLAGAPADGGPPVVRTAVTAPVADPDAVALTAIAENPANSAGNEVATPLAAAPPPVPEPMPAGAAVDDTAGFWVQLGAFRARDGAFQFKERVAAEMAWLSAWLAVVPDAQTMFRLRAGPYRDREQAMDIAARVREALRLVPLVIEPR